MNLDCDVLAVDWCRQRGTRAEENSSEHDSDRRLSLVIVVRIVGPALMLYMCIESIDRQSSQLLNQTIVFPRLIRWIYLNVDLPLKPLHLG